MAYEPERGSFLNGHVPVFRPRQYGDRAANEIDQAIKQLVENAFVRAKDILLRNRVVLDRGAKALLERETLGSAELVELGLLLDRSASRALLATVPRIC